MFPSVLICAHQALADGLRSEERLREDEAACADPQQQVVALTKALFRQGAALEALQRPEEALACYCKGLKVTAQKPMQARVRDTGPHTHLVTNDRTAL